MDPTGLANPEWSDIGKLLTSLWIVAGLVLFLAGNLLIGHALIPSLVASFDLPPIVQKTRPFFYAVAGASFVAAIFFLSRVIGLSGVLDRFWRDYWI